MGGKIFFSFFYWGSKKTVVRMIFCLQYLTIKVCDYKLGDINFAVLNFGISNRVQRINKLNTNKQKQRKGLWKVELRRF